jgi:hypothetical protein
MMRVRLIHWNAAEARERAVRLRAIGYNVDEEPLDAAGLRRLRADPPDAIVIDLSRMPSQGRDLGLNVRKYKATRKLPLVFVGGALEKVAQVRNVLPDAVYTTWGQIDHALEGAIAHPLSDPVVPRSVFDVYAGRPLAAKLGIKPHAVVALVDAPPGFEKTLGVLPEGVVLRQQGGEHCDLALWFVRSQEDLERGLAGMAAPAGQGRLWIAWPKKASGVASDLSQTVVRQAGLAAGLVDYKICSIDETWSGLCFTVRRQKPA